MAPRAPAEERVRTLRVFQRDSLARTIGEKSASSVRARGESIARVSAREV
jgi:hypothetical protein